MKSIVIIKKSIVCRYAISQIQILKLSHNVILETDLLKDKRKLLEGD